MNWKIYLGLGIIFCSTVYMLTDSGGDRIVKLDENDSYSDFELAEASNLSKSKMSLSDIADEGSQKALGSSEEVETHEDTQKQDLGKPDASRRSKEQDKKSEESNGECGSSKNLDCIPNETQPNEANSTESKPSGNVRRVSSKPPAPRPPSAPTEPVKRKNWSDAETRKNALIAMGSGKAQTIEATSSTADSDKYIKKGSKYYGFIDERVVVYKGGDSQFLNIYITGQASKNATRKPFALYAKASWARYGIKVEVLDCLSIDPRQLSIKCEGQVSDVVKGGVGLDSKVYNPSTWGKMLKIASNVLAGFHLDQITETIAPTGQILSFGSSDRVQRAMAEAWIEAGKEAKSVYTGDRAEASPGAIVKILIKEDVRLW